MKKREGRCDILVNCAYPRTADWGNALEAVSFESWKENLDSHLGGYFLCCREAAEMMRGGAGGAIVNFASIYGMVAPDFGIYAGTEMTMPVGYSAIKSGILGVTKYFATYFAKDGIRVNSVSPGGISNNQPSPFVENYSNKTPMGRMGEPGEVVGSCIVSLCRGFFLCDGTKSGGGWWVDDMVKGCIE